jgi:hypothetical protein
VCTENPIRVAEPSEQPSANFVYVGRTAPIRAPIVSAFLTESDRGPSRVPTKGGGLEERT